MFKGELRPYQQEAKERMVDRGQMLLAIVMGGGKTPTTIAAVEELIEMGDVERCLVVVPAALKYQWRDEIAKFSNSKSIVIDGNAKKRKELWRKAQLVPYTIVNPETLLNDTKLIGSVQCIVVDEASMLKNRTAKRTRLMRKLGKTVPFRFALTGTPVENRPEELFSLMEFVDPDVLGDFKLFDHTFIVRDGWGKVLRYRNLDQINKTMQECMVRLSFDDIKDQMPDVVRQVIPVEFDAKGAALYQRIASELLVEIGQAIRMGGFDLWSHYNDPAGNEAQGKIMSKLTVLRMLCDNPELIVRSAANFNDDNVKAGSQYAAELVADGALADLKAAPKLYAVIEYIEAVLESDPDNKIVLFSFFKDNLNLIKKATSKVTKSVIFTGDMSAQEKDAAKKQFQTDPDTRLFLSSDAGGYGVDLPQANFLISYDLPWSSGKLEQREARIIRLSSEFPHVTVATFVMRGSIEERMYQMLQQKKQTGEAFIDGKHQDADKGMKLSLDTLTEFLQYSSVA